MLYEIIHVKFLEQCLTHDKRSSVYYTTIIAVFIIIVVIIGAHIPILVKGKVFQILYYFRLGLINWIMMMFVYQVSQNASIHVLFNVNHVVSGSSYHRGALASSVLNLWLFPKLQWAFPKHYFEDIHSFILISLKIFWRN